jgi:hypothetical protein
MRSQQSESSLTKQSTVVRLFGFVAAVGCVAVGAGAMAVGLIVPSWDIFKSSPKVPAPTKTLALTMSSSNVNSVPASAAGPQNEELIVRSDAPSQHSDEPTTSPLDRTPVVSLQDADSKASSEPPPETKAPTAPPAIVSQHLQMNSAVGTTSQDSEAPVATSSIVSASPTSPPEVESKPPTATPLRDSHPMRSVQNSAPTLAEHKSRSRGGPTIGQRMWYK